MSEILSDLECEQILDQQPVNEFPGMPFEEMPFDKVNCGFFLITFLVAFVGTPIYLWLAGSTPALWVLAVVLYSLGGISITAGYHRLFSHRAYEAILPVKIFFLLFGASTFEGSCLKWSFDHRRHHRYVDTPLDPYNINKGFWWAHMGWLIHRDRPEYSNPHLTDLDKDPWVRFQHQHFLAIGIFMAFVLPTLIGLAFGRPVGGFIIGGVLRLVLIQQGTFFINSLAHTLGRRPYSLKHTARDNLITAILTFGEGYHNYHHEFPSDYRNGIRWFQYDPSKWLIKTFSSLGMAWNLRSIPKYRILMAKVELGQKVYPRPAVYEKIEQLKEKLELAQKNMKEFKDRYEIARSEWTQRGSIQIEQLKADFKKAKQDWKAMQREFREACHMWIEQTQQFAPYATA